MKILSILLLLSVLIIPATAYHNQIWCNANNAEVYLDEEFIGRIENKTLEFEYEYDAEIAPHFIRIYHPNYEEWWEYLPQDDYYAEIVLGVLGSDRQDGIIEISAWHTHEGQIEGAEVYIQHSLHWNTSYTYEGLTPLTLILPEGRYYYIVYKEGYEPVKGMGFVVPVTPGFEENSKINWDIQLEYGISPLPNLVPTKKPFPTPIPTPEPIYIEKEVFIPYEKEVYVKVEPTLIETMFAGIAWFILFVVIITTSIGLYLQWFKEVDIIGMIRKEIKSHLNKLKGKIKKDVTIVPKYDLLVHNETGIKDIKYKLIGKIMKWKKKILNIVKIIKE